MTLGRCHAYMITQLHKQACGSGTLASVTCLHEPAAQILATAAELFAARGFHGVSVADLGAACGISGPALYKHFPSKDAMLAEMLVSISEDCSPRDAHGSRRPRNRMRRSLRWWSGTSTSRCANAR